MAATVTQIQPVDGSAAAAVAAFDRHLERVALAANTVTAYRRQVDAYAAWLHAHAGEHPDAFVDLIGAEAAVTAWRRALLAGGPDRAPLAGSTVNQALAAVALLYEHGARLRIKVKRVRIDRPGEPNALTRAQQGAVQRGADRRGIRDAAVIAVLLGTGARAEECARLTVADVPLTARTGQVRLLGKGDQPRHVPVPARTRERVAALVTTLDPPEGALWRGQRGPLTVAGITQLVLAVGAHAAIPGLRPHRLRHTYATRLREDGADVAQIQALLGHHSVDTSGRYFRAGHTELTALVDRVFPA
jgi:site-specific recombinase XerD